MVHLIGFDKIISFFRYDLLCQMCGAFICRSTDIRVILENQYVCCDPTIWERIEMCRNFDGKVIFHLIFDLHL